MFTSLELCAGAGGGQALGLEKAGFEHEALVEIDSHCCNTLRANRPSWNVVEDDLRVFKERAADFKGVDLVAGGLPCPPFSLAGKRLGERDKAFGAAQHARLGSGRFWLQHFLADAQPAAASLLHRRAGLERRFGRDCISDCELVGRVR